MKNLNVYLCFFLFLCFTLITSSCKKDPCESVQCFNGGFCDNGNCECPEGFGGFNCEIQTDPCLNIVCLNNGSCSNGICNCTEGFTGSDCSAQITPSKIRISNVRVTKFPATDGGAGWDLTSGPDIYINMEYNGAEIYEHPTFFQNADPSFTYDFVPNINLNMNNPTDRYIIRLYDFDDFDQDDFMGGIEFSPYQDGNNFPTTLTIDAGGNVAFDLSLIYTF